MLTDPLNLFEIPTGGLAEMYSRMGKALWYCQCFEEILAYHLCLLYDLDRGVAEDIAQRTLADKKRKTLGQLVKEIAAKKDPLIPDELEKRLSLFTEERNWLAHRIQSQNHTDLYHRDRFDRLLRRLDALKVESHNLSKVFERFLDDWFQSQGISKKQLAQRMEQTLLEWKKT